MNSTEIVLGRSGNTRSVIRNSYDYSDMFQTYTPELLHCNEFRLNFHYFKVNPSSKYSSYICMAKPPKRTENWNEPLPSIISHPIAGVSGFSGPRILFEWVKAPLWENMSL